MPFKTTHDERVAMVREHDLETLNGMWHTLLEQGTAEAIAAFEAAMDDAGYTREPRPDTELRDVLLGLWRPA